MTYCFRFYLVIIFWRSNCPWFASWYELKCWLFSHVWLFATPGTVAHQPPLSMGFSRQEYWSGLPLPSPRGSHPPKLPLDLIFLPHCLNSSLLSATAGYFLCLGLAKFQLGISCFFKEPWFLLGEEDIQKGLSRHTLYAYAHCGCPYSQALAMDRAMFISVCTHVHGKPFIHVNISNDNLTTHTVHFTFPPFCCPQNASLPAQSSCT